MLFQKQTGLGVLGYLGIAWMAIFPAIILIQCDGNRSLVGVADSNPSAAIAFSISGTNIAPSGTGYAWAKNTTATSNGNRVTKTGINDNNLTSNVDAGVGDFAGAWQGGGVIWSDAESISSVSFINGDV